MRSWPPAAAAALLAACGGPEPAGQEMMGQTGDAAERVECATDGDTRFAPLCTVEHRSGAEGVTLILRTQHGSFRRLLIVPDGRGVVTADGAQPAVVTPIGNDRIEVEIAGDRYRLPATVR